MYAPSNKLAFRQLTFKEWLGRCFDLMEYHLCRNNRKPPENWKLKVWKFPWMVWRKAKWDVPKAVHEAFIRLGWEKEIEGGEHETIS